MNIEYFHNLNWNLFVNDVLLLKMSCSETEMNNTVVLILIYIEWSITVVLTIEMHRNHLISKHCILRVIRPIKADDT